MTAKFIIITDMREPVGVEEIKGRSVILNVDHIVKIDNVEAHITEFLDYNCTILVSTGNHIYTKETLNEITQLLNL